MSTKLFSMIVPIAALLALCGFVGPCNSQQVTDRTVSSIEELRQVAGGSNQKVRLRPGEYWLDKNGKNPAFLDLSGTNSTFIFTGCHIKVDSQNLKGFGTGHENRVRLILLSGSNITVDGLTLSTEIVDGKEGWADMYTNSIEITGSGATLRNIDLTTRGSRPYGSGDAFGKGGRPADGNQPGGTPFKLHSKHNGIRTGNGAGNITLENVVLHRFSFGHGIYFQEGSHDILVKNCQVIGDEMANSNDIIADPLYQQYGKATYGEKIPADIRLSKQEDGIRVYGPSGSFGAVKNVRIENTKVVRMRDAYALGDMEGKLEIVNSEAWGCETGFTPASTGATITGCKGDAIYGPLLFFRRSGENVTAQVELAGDQPAQGVWPIALISGKNNKVTLTRTAAAKLYPEDAWVQVSQAWREWRHRPDTDIDRGPHVQPTSDCTIVNKTGQMVVLGVKATNNKVTSDAPVIDKGQGNSVQAPAWTPRPVRIKDTWGEYQVYPAATTAAAPEATSTAVASSAEAVTKADVPAPLFSETFNETTSRIELKNGARLGDAGSGVSSQDADKAYMAEVTQFGGTSAGPVALIRTPIAVQVLDEITVPFWYKPSDKQVPNVTPLDAASLVLIGDRPDEWTLRVAAKVEAGKQYWFYSGKGTPAWRAG